MKSIDRSITEEELARRPYYPHDPSGKGKWLKKPGNPNSVLPASLSRLIFYARQLRALGMSDADISCMFGDLYWDSVEEIDLNRAAAAAPGESASTLPLPASPQLLSNLWQAVDEWETAFDVSKEAVADHDAVRHTSCYIAAEHRLLDAVEAVRVARQEPIRSERVLPSFGELELAARERQAAAEDELHAHVVAAGGYPA